MPEKEKNAPLAKEKKVAKSLRDVAKSLNKSIHRFSETRADVTVFQVYCTRDRKVVSGFLFDEASARAEQTKHQDETGHICRVLPIDN